MTTPSEAAQIAALRRVAYAREYPNEPANCDQQAVLDACDLAERLLQERDAAREQLNWFISHYCDGMDAVDDVVPPLEEVKSRALDERERRANAEARVRTLEDAARGFLAAFATSKLDNIPRALFAAKDHLHDVLSERVLDGGGER